MTEAEITRFFSFQSNRVSRGLKRNKEAQNNNQSVVALNVGLTRTVP